VAVCVIQYMPERGFVKLAVTSYRSSKSHDEGTTLAFLAHDLNKKLDLLWHAKTDVVDRPGLLLLLLPFAHLPFLHSSFLPFSHPSIPPSISFFIPPTPMAQVIYTAPAGFGHHGHHPSSTITVPPGPTHTGPVSKRASRAEWRREVTVERSASDVQQQLLT
jgi:hypothetical protein